MNKYGMLLATTALAGVLAMPGTADAQSAKAAARTDDNVNLIRATNGTTQRLNALVTTIKTANAKDLFVSISMQCGLSTNTQIFTDADGIKATREKSVADAEVQMRLQVDGDHDGIHPNPSFINSNGIVGNASGWVTLCKRKQELEGFLGQAIFCTESNLTSGLQFDECDLDTQDIELTLTTFTAHSFNFVVENLGAGDHQVDVDFRVVNTTSGTVVNSQKAVALVGAASMLVEEVRLVKDAVIDMP